MKKHHISFSNRNWPSIMVGENDAIIDVAEAAGYVLPIACRYGGCITCAAKLISGKVKQPNATAINKRQSQDGYILLCVARPSEDCIIDVGVDSHDTLYLNPFKTLTSMSNIMEGRKKNDKDAKKIKPKQAFNK